MARRRAAPGAADAVGVGTAVGEDGGDALVLGGERRDRLLRLRAAGREELRDARVVELVGEEQPPEERLARVLRLERRGEPVAERRVARGGDRVDLAVGVALLRHDLHLGEARVDEGRERAVELRAVRRPELVTEVSNARLRS